MPQSAPFRSLRRRLLGPIIACALIAAILVAVGSYWWGAHWARDELQTRFQSVRDTLADSEFPMNQVVLQSVAQLTQTELVAFGESGNVLHRTIETPPGTLDAQQIVVSKQGTEQRYVAFRFATVRGPARSDGVCDVLVLFDEKSLTEKRNRAALLPLVTGGSTILALSSITLLLTSKLIRRIAGLQQRVESVAAGDFQTVPQDAVSDEVGQLSGAVDNMAGQLDQLWNEVNRQQSEKLLHQIAGGMAHQLRNSLTGARMAVELHQQECRTDDHGLNIAIDQIELSEDYVRRLLLAASGRQDADHPMGARQCCEKRAFQLGSGRKALAHRRGLAGRRCNQWVDDFRRTRVHRCGDQLGPQRHAGRKASSCTVYLASKGLRAARSQRARPKSLAGSGA